ncbi:hypothetical protein KCU77_g6954, partial [Aureobasidium melanogenum]
MTDPFFRRSMIPSATMGKKHLPELEAALQLWDEGRFGECVAATLDWDLAEECRLNCETLCHLTRKRYRGHPDGKVHATLQSLRESLNEWGKVQEEEGLKIEIEEVALSFNGTSDNTAYEDMVDTRPKSTIFKENKPVRRMTI